MRFALPADMGKRIRDTNMGRLPRTIDVTDFLVVAEVVISNKTLDLYVILVFNKLNKKMVIRSVRMNLQE